MNATGKPTPGPVCRSDAACGQEAKSLPLIFCLVHKLGAGQVHMHYTEMLYETP